MTDNIAEALAWAENHTTTNVIDAERVGVDDLLLASRPAGAVIEEIDLNRFRDKPRRLQGVTSIHTPDSFVIWVAAHRLEALDLYADIDRFRVTAVLNPQVGTPAHQDYRAVLNLRPSPQWKRWTKVDGETLEQARFAEHIMLCSSDIADPPALDMLEMAETLEINASATISSAERQRDGQRRLVFNEQVDAKSRSGGLEVDVPSQFTLNVPLFEGGQPEIVPVRLLYRARAGAVFFIPQIIDRDDIERLRFQADVDVIAGALNVSAIAGTA